MSNLERTLFEMILRTPMGEPIPPEQIKKELDECIEKMHQVSGHFYRQAIQLNNHPFIEFAGLMNEYIKACARAAHNGQDFRFSSIHTEEGPLKLLGHEIKYIQEKLECIYGDQIFERIKDD